MTFRRIRTRRGLTWHVCCGNVIFIAASLGEAIEQCLNYLAEGMPT